MIRLFPRPWTLMLLAAVAGQAYFWSITRDWRSDYTVILPPPSEKVTDLMALGDPQFLFRVWGQQLENTGDTAGRVTPLEQYDYDRVVGWLETLDGLDRKSHYAVGLGTSYFGLTRDPEDARKIVHYTRRHVTGQLDTKWFWLADAILIARDRVKDNDLVIAAARELSEADDQSVSWQRTLLPVALAEAGKYAEAEAVMADLYNRYANESSDWEVNIMEKFIAEMRRRQQN